MPGESRLWAQFCAGAYTTRSQNIDNEQCINVYLETVDAVSNPKKVWLIGAPGSISLKTVSDTVCRGMFSQDGRHFAVIGPTLYELTLSGSGSTLAVITTNRGTLANDGTLCFFASNGKGGNQILISSAGNLYVFTTTTNVLSAAITLPMTNAPGAVLFLNTYFLAIETGTLKVWFSEQEDGTNWNGLDFVTRSNTSDNLIGMVTLHDQIKVFGSKTSELLYDAGEADNPFLPYPGSISQDGALAATGIAVNGEQILWLAKNEWNVVRVMSSGVGEAKIISTPAVEFALASYTKVSDVETLAYEQEGHPFVCFTFPTADVTWVYDIREGMWHQRTSRWNVADDTVHRWRYRGTCAPGSQATLVGDYATGDIYLLSLDLFSENCSRIKRVRRAPYLGAENQWIFLDQVELGVQPGVGNTSGVYQNPVVNLRVSRDFGNTFNANVTAPLGANAAYLSRAIWRRVGRARADRLVLEVNQTDPVRTVWGPGLHLRITEGNGLL